MTSLPVSAVHAEVGSATAEAAAGVPDECLPMSCSFLNVYTVTDLMTAFAVTVFLTLSCACHVMSYTFFACVSPIVNLCRKGCHPDDVHRNSCTFLLVTDLPARSTGIIAPC